MQRSLGVDSSALVISSDAATHETAEVQHEWGAAVRTQSIQAIALWNLLTRVRHESSKGYALTFTVKTASVERQLVSVRGMIRVESGKLLHFLAY